MDGDHRYDDRSRPHRQQHGSPSPSASARAVGRPPRPSPARRRTSRSSALSPAPAPPAARTRRDRAEVDPRSPAGPLERAGPMIPSVVQRVTSPVFIGREGEVDAARRGDRTRVGRHPVDRARRRRGGHRQDPPPRRADGARPRARRCSSSKAPASASAATRPSRSRRSPPRCGPRPRPRPRRARRTARRASTGELARLVPGARRHARRAPLMTARPNWAQTRLFEGLLTLLGRLGERVAGRSSIVEDLHWADRSTRDMLAFLARNARTRADARSSPRTGPTSCTAATRCGRGWPRWSGWPRVVPDRARAVRPRRSCDGSSRRSSARAPTSELLEAIARRSAGNPFFAEELVACWRGRRPATGCPTTCATSLLGRSARCRTRPRTSLGVAAVAGRPWTTSSSPRSRTRTKRARRGAPRGGRGRRSSVAVRHRRAETRLRVPPRARPGGGLRRPAAP